ncbi:hypothetical protein EDB86DRAFT_3177262 [Lactarius hatsudake]|nr:hypothetical protein EDB86DRAFT_3177262 [Lactarius hatsudake]
MGSPESEEPTIPALLTTQVGPTTQQALVAALPSPSTHAPTDSQQLWDNVPSLPTALPPQPEVIEVLGRTTPTANKTPRPRSRALSNASVWSHATVESNVSIEVEPSIAKPPSSNNFTFKWHTLAAAVRAGFLSDPMDPNAISMSGYDPDGDEDEFLADINQTLDAEIRQDVSTVLQGWSTYKLLCPVELRKGHDLPTTANEFNCMVNSVLTALDAGVASHDGETMVKGLTPQSWMRLVLATLSAILRGALRSPSSLRTGSRSLNGVDTFPLHADLDRPLTEGGAIMLMCQQLGGLYASNRNHPDKAYPESYFTRLITLLDSRMHQVPLPNPATHSAPTPLMEAERAQVTTTIRERLILEGIETARVDERTMTEIKEAVKAEIFANMNAEALENIDDWRAVYKHKFTEAMHQAFEAQYLGIHPDKGKHRVEPPLTTSQIVRDAQPRIQQEVRLQVEARIAGIHDEIKASIAVNDPFWGQGPQREAIANSVRNQTHAEVQKELNDELQAIKTAAQSELEAVKIQLQHDQDQAHEVLHAQARKEYEDAKTLFATNLEADLQDFKTAIRSSVKQWKDKYRVSRNLAALRQEARRFGLNIVPIDEGSTAAEKTTFAKYTLPPIEVDGRDISAEPENAPSAPATPFLTPVTHPSNLPDANVTPTPVRVKRSCIGDDLPYPALSDALFAPNSIPILPADGSVEAPLPSTPMEEDLDYALEVATDHLHDTGANIYASIHAALPHPSPPIPVHNPNAPPLRPVRVAQTEQKQEDPLPSTLCDQPPWLEVPSLAPQTAAGGDLAAVLAAINATILGLEARLTTRLDAQDERIRELSTPLKPPQPVTAKRAKGQATVAAVPGPNTPSSSSGVCETAAPVPRVDDPTSHDHVEEIQTPGVAASAADAQQPAPKAHAAHVVREAFQPPPEKHVRLNVDAKGKPTPSTSMPPSWAKITAASTGSKPTPHSPPPKSQPPPAKGWTTGASGNTEVTINRHHGLEDAAFEATIRKMTLAAILAETRTEVDRLTGGKLALLSGRWSKNRNAAIHNFVYTFKGQVPFKAIYPLWDVLVKPLMTGQLVPNDGWTHAQIRDTNTSNNEGRRPNFVATQLSKTPFSVSPRTGRGPDTRSPQTPEGRSPLPTSMGTTVSPPKPSGTVSSSLTKRRTSSPLAIPPPSSCVAAATASVTPQIPQPAPYPPTAYAATSAEVLTTPTITPPTARDPTTRLANAAASSPASTVVGNTMPVLLAAH